MATQEENKAGTHLIVDSLTVLNGIEDSGIKTLKYNVDMLAQTQQMIISGYKDYWSSLADDGVITAAEKKILYKEWTALASEYASLVQAATDTYELPASSAVLVAYKAAYTALYNYVIIELKLFDSMTLSTTLKNKQTFINRYNAYYVAREALKQAIMEGEDTKTLDAAKEYADSETEETAELVVASLTGIAKSSLNYDKTSSNIYTRLANLFNLLTIPEDGGVSTSLLEAMTDAQNKITGVQTAVADITTQTGTIITQEANRITALAEAGSSSAYMSMSVGLPFFVTAARMEEWETALASNATALAYLTGSDGLYEAVDINTDGKTGTEHTAVTVYRMKNSDYTSSAAQQKIKTLTSALRAADQLSSCIVIDADMIQVNGTSLFSSDGTIQQSFVNYSGLATTTALSNLIGALSDDANVTIIDGGYIKTSLIDVAVLAAKSAFINALFSNTITLQTGGKIKSSNYASGSAGFCINADGSAEFNDVTMRGTAYAKDIVFQNVAVGENVLGNFGMYAVSSVYNTRTFTAAFPGRYKMVVSAQADSNASDKTIYVYKNGTAISTWTPSESNNYVVSGTLSTDLAAGDVLTAATGIGRTANCYVTVTIYTDLQTDSLLYWLSQTGFSGDTLS